jgi:hypothetical protein
MYEEIRGDVKDVCAELRKDLERFGNITVGAWLRRRKLEEAEAKQFGMTIQEFRDFLTIKKN